MGNLSTLPSQAEAITPMQCLGLKYTIIFQFRPVSIPQLSILITVLKLIRVNSRLKVLYKVLAQVCHRNQFLQERLHTRTSLVSFFCLTSKLIWKIFYDTFFRRKAYFQSCAQ
jgi:hypothetical protein